MDTLQIALVAAAFASLLIGMIEIKAASRADFRACMSLLFVFYLGLLIIGNVATTSLASSVVLRAATGADSGESSGIAAAIAAFPGQQWFWCAFVGVFGFEALLKRMNVTLFDQGVLTINDWIAKARDAATADAIEKQTNRNNARLQNTANFLCDHLSEADMFAQAINALGADKVKELRESARAQNANECLSLALAWATHDPKGASAAVEAVPRR